MIYLDTSVALAWLLGEDRVPPDEPIELASYDERMLEVAKAMGLSICDCG